MHVRHTTQFRVLRNITDTVWILAIIAGMGAILAACGGKDRPSSSGAVEITFWHSLVSSSVPALNDLIKRFEEEHPGITVKTQYVPTGPALIQKLVTAVQSNYRADVSDPREL